MSNVPICIHYYCQMFSLIIIIKIKLSFKQDNDFSHKLKYSINL